MRAHLKTLQAQVLPAAVSLDFCHLLDLERSEHDAGAVQAALDEVKSASQVVCSDPRPADAEYAVDGPTHRWSEATFDHLAKNKQRLFDYALAEGYDYFWLIDTDLLLDPMTLASLYAVDEEIVSAVFWTQWAEGGRNLPDPNVWLKNPYGLDGMGLTEGEFLDKLSRRRLLQVKGGGACCLFSREAMEKASYYPRLEGLPQEGMWQGEDRTLALRAERAHVLQWADGWPDIFHAYHPKMREEAVLQAATEMLLRERKTEAAYGDLVNLMIMPLDEPRLRGQDFAVRGRLGGLHMVPELEQAVVDMKVGEERIVEVTFPMTWPIPDLRHRKRILQVQLVDVKEYSFAPVLADHMFGGLE